MSSGCDPAFIVVQSAPEIILVETEVIEQFVIEGPGPQGAPGPAGATGGIAIVTADGDIPIGQLYTIGNASDAITLTLPPISDVLVMGTTTQYTIRDYSGNLITLAGNGSDLVEGDTTLDLIGDVHSWTLIATSLGWLII